MSLLKLLDLKPPSRRPGVAPAHAHHPHSRPGTATSVGTPKVSPPQPAGSSIKAPASPATPQPADDKRYDLKIGHHDLKGATQMEAMRALAAEYQQLRGNCSAERQAHGDRMARGAESLGAAAVAMISEKLGRAEMPSLDIWDPAFAALDRSQQSMRAMSIEGAVQALVEAQEAFRKAHAAVLAYDGKLETGGDRAITGLKVTAAAGAVAAGVATGGAASAAGLGVAGTTGVGAVSAGAYGMTQEVAGQGSEVYLANTRKAIDWKAVLRRGATDFTTGLCAGILGGALTKQFSKMFGSYLGKAISDAELVELGKVLGLTGPLERTFFMTTGQKFIAEFVSGSLLVPVQSAIAIAINRVSGGAPGPKNIDEFMEGIARDVVQGGVFMALVAFLRHAMPPKVASGGSAPPSHGPDASKGEPTHATPPPGKETAPGAPIHDTAAPGQSAKTPLTEKTPASATAPQLGGPGAKVPTEATHPVAEKTVAKKVAAPKTPETPETSGNHAHDKAAPGKETAAVGAKGAPRRLLSREEINAIPGMKKLIGRLSKSNLSLTELGLTEEGLIRLASENPKTVVEKLNRLVDIRETHAAEVEPKGVSRRKKVDAPHANVAPEKKMTRIEALGKTPGKRSSIGKQVIDRMRSAGKLKGTAPNEWVYHEPTKKWFPIDECDMGHTHDAVKWWNSEGMFYGAKSPIVRKWMTDPAIYELEPGDINSRRGAALPDEYVAAHPDPITSDELAGKVKKRR